MLYPRPSSGQTTHVGEPHEPTGIAVAVVEHEGRLLIGQRPPGVPLAGLWEFPGGKVEAGETASAAAARECLEEAGLVIEVGAAYPAVVHQYDHDRLALEFFACRAVDAKVPPRPPFRWVELSELAGLPFPAANAALIEFLSGRMLREDEPGSRILTQRRTRLQEGPCGHVRGLKPKLLPTQPEFDPPK
jgi:8-oxo-dGTP diphosphatase